MSELIGVEVLEELVVETLSEGVALIGGTARLGKAPG